MSDFKFDWKSSKKEESDNENDDSSSDDDNRTKTVSKTLPKNSSSKHSSSKLKGEHSPKNGYKHRHQKKKSSKDSSRHRHRQGSKSKSHSSDEEDDDDKEKEKHDKKRKRSESDEESEDEDEGDDDAGEEGEEDKDKDKKDEKKSSKKRRSSSSSSSSSSRQKKPKTSSRSREKDEDRVKVKNHDSDDEDDGYVTSTQSYTTILRKEREMRRDKSASNGKSESSSPSEIGKGLDPDNIVRNLDQLLLFSESEELYDLITNVYKTVEDGEKLMPLKKLIEKVAHIGVNLIKQNKSFNGKFAACNVQLRERMMAIAGDSDRSLMQKKIDIGKLIDTWRTSCPAAAKSFSRQVKPPKDWCDDLDKELKIAKLIKGNRTDASED